MEKEAVMGLCEVKGIEYLEVSAKSGENVGKSFERMAEMLMKVHPP